MYVILSDDNIGSEMVIPNIVPEDMEPCTLDKDTSTSNGIPFYLCTLHHCSISFSIKHATQRGVMLCIHYSLSAEENAESSGLSAGAAAGVAVVLTTLVMFVLGAASGGLVGWYVSKKKTVFRVATKSGEGLVLERKSDPHEKVEVEEQKDQ